MNENRVIEIRKKAIERHNIDSSIFQGDYEDFKYGRYTNEFIYGRYQIFEEIDRLLSVLPTNSKILDLGCGTGHFSNYMKKRGFEVVGLDPSVKMLDFAKKNFPDIPFIEGISTELPFAADSFDLVVSIEVLRYLHPKDVADTYKEVHRILKSNGTFFMTHVNRFAFDAYYFFYYFKYFLHRLRGKQYHNCYFTTSKEEEKLLKAAGFKNIQSVGRMFASIRIGYLFSKRLGRVWAKLVSRFNQKERFLGNPSKATAGHLIIVCTK